MRTDFSVDRKADDSPVSEADRLAEMAIPTRLSAAMPEFPSLPRKRRGPSGAPDVGRSFLLVDPLDGTKEFISRNGEFTVNIALIEDGAPIMGVVLAPALGLAYAGSAVGAWKGTIATERSRGRWMGADQGAPCRPASCGGREPLASNCRDRGRCSRRPVPASVARSARR